MITRFVASFERRRDWPVYEPYAVAGAFVLFVTLLGRRATDINNYTRLADAWLHGHSWIHFPGDWIDAVPYHGRAYIVEAPFPAILMLPFARLSGTDANQSFVTLLVAAAGLGAIVAIGRCLGFGARDRLLFAAFFTCATSYLYCVLHGDVWFLAHVTSVTFTFFALLELLGKRRPWVVAACSVAAGFSRYALLPAAFLYPVYLLWTSAAPQRRAIIAQSAGIIAFAFILWGWYNQVRWGNPVHNDFQYFYRVMAHGEGSAFRLDAIPHQLHEMFERGPDWSNRFPWAQPSRFGMAITYTAFPLLAALWARRPLKFVVLLWVLSLLTLVPSLVYYDFGEVQFSQRHALDFQPFLLVLSMLALRPRLPRWYAGLLLLGTAIGAVLLWITEMLY